MSNAFDDVVLQLAHAKKSVCVTAAAGCGKTEAIAQAVKLSQGKQLILTHTNAGVAELRSRLRKKNISETKYSVETIASWLLKYILAYPSMSGFSIPHPQYQEWNDVYPAAQKIFNYSFIKDVLQASYDGVFVDEYQDCSQEQHFIILKIAEKLSVRVLGDPLQGIFKFGNNKSVEWEKDIIGNFQELPALAVPYRWRKNNPELGEQIIEIRKKLLKNEQIDLREYTEINWLLWSDNAEVQILSQSAKLSGTVSGIHSGRKVQISAKKEHLDRISAKKVHGKYQCLEEMGCYTLMSIAKYIDGCLEQNSSSCLRGNLERFLKEGIAEYQTFKNSELDSALDDLDIYGVSAIPEIINVALERMPVYRRELFVEMKKTAQQFLINEKEQKTFQETAYAVRHNTSVNGRNPEAHIISRTLLIKGLQFNHAIVLNADKLQNKESFYVAITRGFESLTVLSSNPIIKFDV